MAVIATPWYRTKWANLGGLAVGAAAIVAATAIGAGTQLASSPVASAGPKATATVSGVADPNTISAYMNKLAGPYQQMGNALTGLANALQASDWEAISSSCQQLRASGESFAATLPSPDSRVTPRIRAMADNIGKAADVCAQWGPGSPVDVAALMSHIDDAKSDLRSAKLVTGST